MKELTLAAVIRDCQQHVAIPATPRQWQVLNHVMTCRTAALGGALYQCQQCQHRWIWYHSCRDRHCPQCQSKASDLWCARQKEQLLPVPYFHLVFTLPHCLNPWVARHSRVIYQLLFRSAWAALSHVGQRRLGGQLGMTSVLHTWGQQLTRHVHLHCLVPSGVIRPGRGWHTHNRHYLLPVKVLSHRYRGLMVSGLRDSIRHGLLPDIPRHSVNTVLDQLMRLRWVVYSKAAISYTPTLVNYLARYTHRIGLSNSRLVGCQQGKVGVRWQDYRHQKKRTMWVTPVTLIKRFLLHVLPKGFMRIRHYGYLSNAVKGKRLATIKTQLQGQQSAVKTYEADASITATSGMQMCCPECLGNGVIRRGEVNSLRTINSS